MHLIGRLFDGLVLCANMVMLFIFMVSAYSDHISPKSSVYASYLGILFPFFLVVVLLFMLYWVMRVKWYALISLFFLLGCWEPVTRYLPYHLGNQAPNENSIKLLTYNTCGLGRYNLSKAEKKNDVLEFIKSENPDIVCLQEYSFDNRKGAMSEARIRKTLKSYPYYHFKPSSVNMKQSGLAIFSKYPIVKVKAIDYKSMYNSSCLYELDVNGKRITVINNHLESNKLSPEDRKFYDAMIMHFEAQKIDEFRNTLVNKLGNAYKIRAAQAEKLKGIIDNVKTPLIVCGDLNDTPISYCYQTIRGNMTDAFRNSGFGPGITYHENKFLFRIDHIFHNDSLHSYNAKVHHVNWSDHYPVSVYMDLMN